MKKLVLFVFLFATFQAFGQFSNYTNINGRYKWIAGKFDSTFTLPSGSTPSLRTGGGTGPGAMFYRTSDSTIYQYTGTQWIKLRGSISPSDTAGLWMTNVYRKPGSDSVFYVKGGTHTFAFRDSIGVGGGGGGGKIYYFNGGVSMGTFGGLPMYELGDTANTGAAANFTKSTTGAIANFITDPNKPGLLQIPAGTWTIDAWVSETGGGANHAQIWAVLEKWDGSTITTIATSPIEEITNGSAIDLYTWSLSVPTTSITVTDRIIIQFYITNTNGKTVTLYTQNGYVGEVHTTFTTGIGSLNGLTAPSQYFATGTSGTDFAISSSTATHTFNLPTASATNRGALSSSDWTTFNGKVGGSGTINYVPKFTASGTIGNSQIFDNGTSVGINTASPSASYKLDISGNLRTTTGAVFGSTSGNVLIGTTTDAGYKLDISGTTRINGTELRLDNGTTGTINLYSATPSIQFFSGDPTGYRFYRSGTNMIWNSGSTITMQIAGNDGYSLTSANGHIWRTATSGGAALARLDVGGSLSIGNASNAANASSILDLTSTTKGFLPPRMTGAQAEAIATPATGLMVYANNGNGTTITSTGWWGYNGTTWVKLN